METPKTKPVSQTKPEEKQELIVVSSISLTPRQIAVISARTPDIYVKTKPARGGKTAKFVEGGYITHKLNEAFGPLNWDWKILEHGETNRKNETNAEGEVWVRGQLSVKDHVKGYLVIKEAFGQHPVHKNVPFGDALKAASTDALKKAAAQGFGIALDVYWGLLDADNGKESAPKQAQRSDLAQKALTAIRAISDIQELDVVRSKLTTTKLYTQAQKIEMFSACNEREKQIIASMPKVEPEVLPSISIDD